MGKLLIAACVTVAACKMYGEPPGPLRKPEPRNPPKSAPPTAKLEYIEQCTVDFRAAPTKTRKKAEAARLVDQGDARYSSIKNPAVAKADKVDQIDEAVRFYREALVQDPYHAGATLKLALAYDEILRKRCAIALLERLYQMTSHPDLRPQAEQQIGLVVDNPQWFAGYRNDALRAIGH